MSNLSDFVIENGVLKKYSGPGGDVVVPEGVTCIGDQAFYNRSTLTSITIPEGVKRISREAFKYCSALTDITLPGSVTSIEFQTFEGCWALESISIPESVTNIDDFAFSHCIAMKSITIPEGVTSIGGYAFRDCNSLTSITIPESVTSIGERAFEDCHALTSITIPKSVTGIGEGAFEGCHALTSITIPEGVTSIADLAFSGCSALKSITLPESLTDIFGWAFKDCKKLTSITIPGSVKSIGYRAFQGCSALKSITIEEGVTSIGSYAIADCTALTSITIPDSVTSIGYRAFYGCSGLADDEGLIIVKGILFDYLSRKENVTIPNNWMFHGCYNLKSIAIPNGVTRIEDYVFAGCKVLTSITIPHSVTNIGSYAIADCTALTSITIPDNVTSIGEGAFKDCSSLTSINIPESVTSVGANVFEGCNKLEKLTVSKNLKSLGKDPFGKSLPKGLAGGADSFWHALTDGSIKQYILAGSAKTALWAKLPETVKADIFLSRQGKSLTGAYLDCIGEDGILPLGEALLDKLKGELSAKECNAVLSFMTMFSLKAPGELLNRLFRALKAQKNGKKAVEAIESNAELTTLIQQAQAGSSDSESKSDPFAAMMLANKASAKETEVRLKEYYGLNPDDLPAIAASDGGTVPPAFVAWLITLHEEQRVPDWGGMPIVASAYPPGLRPEAAEALAMIDARSLQSGLLNLADKFLDKYVNTKKRYLSFPICRYADEATMAEMTTRAPKWITSVSGIDAPPLGEFRSAVCYSNTRAAMLFAEKYNELDRYALARGTDADTIRDQMLSDVGLDAQGCKFYDLGNQIVTARLQKDLSFLFELPDGKTSKSLPRKGADPVKYEAANSDFSEMKKLTKKIVRSRSRVLFDDFLSGRSRKSTDWQESYLKNPLLRETASLLVWAQGKKTFTISDSGPVDSLGKAYTISDTGVKVAHPMDMKPSEVAAWQKYFAAHCLKQPFLQIWEPVIDLRAVREDRYKGCMIPYYRFVHQEKHGITVQDFDFHNDIAITLKDCNANVERIDWGRHEIDMSDRFEIQAFSIQKATRQANHIVAYLDRITVWDRLRKDDVSVRMWLDNFTLAQITEFIAAAQESNAVNVLALLLDYKNDHFADYDPMDEFTLE